MSTDTAAEQVQCLEHDDTCRGKVEYRMALSATGVPFARCDSHWSRRLDVQERIDRLYPDSPFPPADFDPTAAGESWDEDDW